MSNDWFRPAGSTARAPFALEVTQKSAGWEFSSLRVLELDAGGSAAFPTGEEEMVLLPLSGGCTVEVAGEVLELAGRESVFTQVSDFAYLPLGSEVTVTSAGGGRFALPGARATGRLPARRVDASDVPVELRGAGSASRQVNNFCSPDAFEADKLIAVEVLTPGGNWSSYPPHKHDVQSADEVALEEVYYYEVAGPSGPAPHASAYQRVYTSGEGREIDVCVEVATGDVVLIPHGYHGPSMAGPGYDLYYLNVMAGPGTERVWKFCDDPAHAWVRGTWDDQPVDPRLPLTSAQPSASRRTS